MQRANLDDFGVVGSASAKWALLGPIMVPMLMALGVSPDLTQAAYRVGDSTTNIIITPALFPTGRGVLPALREVHRHRHFAGIDADLLSDPAGHLLIGFWVLGIPLGLGASYLYPPH